MKISVGQITTLPKSMETDVQTLSKAGFRDIEITFGKVNAYLENHSLAQLRRLFDDAGLRAVSAIGLAPDTTALLLSRGEVWDKYKSGLEAQFKVCREMGCEMIGIGADPAKYAFPGWEENAVSNLREAGDLAAEYGLKLGLEFMFLAEPIGPFVLDNFTATLELVEKAGHPNVGWFLDLFHMYNGGDIFVAIEKLDISKLLNVHFLDIPDKPSGYMGDGDRLLPGKGILPLEKIAALLRDKSYKGHLCLELLNEDVWNMDAQDAANACFASMEPFIGI